MKKSSKVALTLASCLAIAGISSAVGAAATDAPEGIVGLHVIGMVDADGSKLAAIAAEYDVELDGSTVDATDFEIEDYDFANEKLPPIEIMNGEEHYYDPVRQKPIKVTPEETVRQEVISFLIDKLKVPMRMLRVEESLAHHVADCLDRSDIIIMRADGGNENVVPLAVIECKREDLALDDTMVAQAKGYTERLECKFFMLTNGKRTLCFYLDEEGKRLPIKSFREYTAMLNEEYTELPEEEPFERRTFEEIENAPAYFVYDVTPYEMGEETTDDGEKLIFCSNLWECLLDTDYEFVPYDYEIFHMVNDYGVRRISWGNTSGGHFGDCRCRSIGVKYKGESKIVSFAFCSYVLKNADRGRTGFFVVIESKGHIHSSLQIPMDAKNILQMNGSTCSINHTGRITVGNTGAGKISELKEFVRKEYPKIIDGKLFKLGELPTDRLLYLSDEKVCDFIENVISYALIRDEYRKFRLIELN